MKNFFFPVDVNDDDIVNVMVFAGRCSLETVR